MRIKQQVYWYWYSQVKMLLWIIGNLLKTARRNFLFNRISRPSLKRDLQSFRIWMKQNTKYCTQKNYFFFGYYTHAHQKLLTKKKRVLFVDESFNFSLFSRVLRVKSSMPISFPWSFWLVMWKCTTKQECLHIKNWKTSGNEIT